MKTRIIICISIAAVATLSFTFASVKSNVSSKAENKTENNINAPVGGLVLENQL